jgi:hypothetical protein
MGPQNCSVNLKSIYHLSNVVLNSVVSKVSGALQSGARKNYENAPKRNYQLMKFFLYIIAA